MDIPIQVDLGRIAQDLQIRRVQVESVVQLLDEGNTVPFITRYRKERTGNLNEMVIHEIQLRVHRLRELAERKETILKAIEAQGKLTPDLATAIRAADNPKRLEDLYLPFKPKKRTKASDARDRGLEPLAFRIWTRDETLTDLPAAAQEFVNSEKGIESVEKVLEGVGHILAEAISEMATVRDGVRKVVWKTGKIVTAKAEMPEGQGLEYRDYFDYSEPIAQIPPHRILAINRGDKEGPLKVKIDVSRPDLESVLFGQLPLDGHPHAELFRAAAIDALERLILPSMEREVRRDLTEGAEKHAVEVFAKNLRGLLLQPPIPKQVVLAIDPGFRTGCKLAVLDRSGNLLDHAVIYPHPPQNRRSEAKVSLKDMVGKHEVGVVAIGNGTACRETEELVAEIIAEGIRFSSPDYVPDAAAADAAPQSPNESASVETPLPRDAAIEAADSESGAQSSSDAGDPSTALVSAADQSPQKNDEAFENNAPGNHDGASHATAEAALEMLPPISGGSPDATSPEAEVEVSPASDENRSTAVLTEGGNEGGDRAGPAASESEQAAAVENSEPHHDPNVAGTEEAHADSSAVASDSAAGETPAQPGAGTDPSAEAAGGVSPTPIEPVKAPAQHPPRPPKQGGHGRSESSKSRSSRVRHAPAPPPEPPKPHPADSLLAQLAYVVVNEAGASVYSTSQVGRDELPDLDATLRSGISIGRRLQDPLAEMVKIEPQNIGVGLYQHDVNPKQLKETLESVISSCVNFVGVDLNTASVPLLRHVSGLNQLTARRIVDYRKEHGPFAGRDQLARVEGIGPATFTQAAGFLKIPEGEHPLDRTWIHPECYPVAAKLLEKFEFAADVVRDKARLPELNEKLASSDIGELSRELEVGEFTLRDIVEALGRPERDPREDLPKPIFKKGILKIEDLVAAMELKGTVLNVVDFGAFVDIGLKDSGLVHISQLANRYVKSPHDVVSVGDVVTVWVMGVDQERKRVSLTMVKPGTERQRGQQAGGGRRGPAPPGEPQAGRDQRGPGQGRRGGGGAGGPRPPRPASSALTSPPVGAPSVAVLAENPGGRRADRDRGGSPPGTGGPNFNDSRGQGAGQGSRPPGPGGGPPRHGHGPGSGPPGRGGLRGPYPGQGPGGARPTRQDQSSTPRPPSRPSRPSPPPPPLSKDALAGNVPLRTFGQLKQLWEAKVEPASASGGEPAQPYAQAATDPAAAAEPSPREKDAAETPATSSSQSDPQASSN
jgi:protein Tex